MSTKVTEKINIRNPFFITADDEGVPDLPAAPEDPIDDPEVPVDYVEPATVTKKVKCGDTIKIGEDVGGKIYTLNVGKATGNVTIDYTVNVPISITGYWDTTTPTFSSTGYIGNDSFEQDLLDAGIGAGNMSLGSGVQTGTVTISKTAETPETVNVLVSAPLRTDDYELTFNCPSAPAITAPVGNVPSTIPSNTGFFEQIPAFYVQVDDNYDGANDSLDLQLKVNDVVVLSEITTTGWYVFSDYDGVQDNFGVHPNVASFGGSGSLSPAKNQGYVVTNGCISEWTTPTTFLAQSDYFTTDLNKIEFIYTLKDSASKWPQRAGSANSAMKGDGSGPYVRFVKSGLFYDTVNSVWRYPINSQRDAARFDWKTSNNRPLTQQNNDTVFIGNLEGVFKTTNPYQGRNEFSNYGDPNKYVMQFFWRSTPIAGLDNPYRNAGTKVVGGRTIAPSSSQFAGRTYKILLDDGAGGRDASTIQDEMYARDSGGMQGCFS